MKKYIKRGLISLIVVVAIVLVGFLIYTSDYYHAKEYQVSNVEVVEQNNFTVYGDVESEVGFIFYPGGKVEAKSYEVVLERLAENGVCSILVEMPFNLAVFDLNAASDVMKDFPQIKNWYIGGHSLGGAMSSGFAVENQESLKGLILLAAYPTKEIDIPVLSIYGDKDGVLNKEKYEESISLAKDLKEVIIKGANHAQFGNYGEQSGDNKADITPERQWDRTSREIINFINDTK